MLIRLEGKDVRKWRLMIGMSQADLARLTNVHRSYICHLEAGRKELTNEFRLRLRDAVMSCPLKWAQGKEATK